MLKVSKTTGLQYLCNKYVKENVKDEVDYFPANKHRRFPQSDGIVLGVYCQVCPDYPK